MSSCRGEGKAWSIMARRLMYSEQKGSVGAPATYLYLEQAQAFHPLRRDQDSQVGGLREHVLGWARDVFLPQGFPESVSPDYLHYQFWDSVQAYCSSIAGALALKSTLVGLGVGEESATPLAATLSWLLKDGSGMVASIAFAYWKGSQLDCNSKQWRLFADFTNNVNLALHLIGPLLPVPFLAVLCVSGVLTALVGVSGGSTRAALAVHQARCDNMADVSAKDGSQETLVNLAALITNLTLLPYFTASLGVTWTTFLLCVFLHMFANYKAMRALTLHSLNRPRLLYLLSMWLNNSAASEESVDALAVPSPAEANLNEPLLFGPAFRSDYFPLGFRVTIGSSLHWALRRCGGGGGDGEALVFKSASDVFGGKQYMLCANLQQRQLHIIYRSDVTPEQELEAFVTAYLCVHNYCHLLEGTPLPSKFVAPNLPTTATLTTAPTASEYQLICAVKEVVRQVFPALMKSLQGQEWRVDKLHFGADEWRLMED